MLFIYNGIYLFSIQSMPNLRIVQIKSSRISMKSVQKLLPKLIAHVEKTKGFQASQSIYAFILQMC